MFYFLEKPTILPALLGILIEVGAVCTDNECNFELTLNYRWANFVNISKFYQLRILDFQ